MELGIKIDSLKNDTFAKLHAIMQDEPHREELEEVTETFSISPENMA